MNSYIDSVDFFKGNNPEKIAAEFGTPLYVYNEEIQVFDLTLSELIELVGNDFIQTDRSRAVNYRHVIGFEGNDFVLDNGRQERISTRRKKQVIRLFMEKRLTFGH